MGHVSSYIKQLYVDRQVGLCHHATTRGLDQPYFIDGMPF